MTNFQHFCLTSLSKYILFFDNYIWVYFWFFQLRFKNISIYGKVGHLLTYRLNNGSYENNPKREFNIAKTKHGNKIFLKLRFT